MDLESNSAETLIKYDSSSRQEALSCEEKRPFKDSNK